MKLLCISLGCDKNLVDAERMLGSLSQDGYTFTDDEQEADVILVNTCCFINDAKEESVNTILEMAEYKKSGTCKLRIYMAASLLFAVQLACQQTFIALGNAKTSVFLALLRKVLLLIPLIFILPHFVSNPVFGVFVAEPVADTIAVATTAALFFREYKKLG